MCSQEVVKILMERPAVLDALLEEAEEGAPAATTVSPLACLDAFILWLLPFTAGCERYCRQGLLHGHICGGRACMQAIVLITGPNALLKLR